MTPRKAMLLAPPRTGPRYVCSACATVWRYVEVRHVLCCPECGGGLLRVRPDPGAGADSALSADGDPVSGPAARGTPRRSW